MRIVVAWDQSAEAANLVRRLTALGHSVTLANNGQAAVACCRDRALELAFLDLLLPGMDGFAVAREIRTERRADAPRLVAITALRSPAAEEVVRSAGFVALLHKPYSNDDLQALLARVTAGQEPTA